MSKKRARTRIEKNKKELKKIRNEKRNAFSNFLIRFILIILLTVCCLLIYARYTATSGLEVKEYNIENVKVPDSFQGFKILHFSDLRYGSTVNKSNLDLIEKKVKEIEPDLIVFTGDLVWDGYSLKDEDRKELTEFLYNLDNNAGKYAVLGDIDNTDTEEILKSGEFTVLKNSSEKIYYKGYTPIILSGSGSSIKKENNYEDTFNYQKEEGSNNLLQISCIHESDASLEIANNYSVDYILDGNSLGGLVRVPAIGNINSLEGSKKNNEEYLKEKDTEIYTSFGIGTTKIKFRYFNRPSVNLYRLYRK